MSDHDENAIVPPPWLLRGDGYVLFYFFKRDFLEPLLSADELARFRGGMGAIAFMDYRASGVGAYGELLFIPGRLMSENGKPRHSITKIYVSTAASLINGHANWGIPKQRAYFQHETRLDNHDSVKAWMDGVPAFELIAVPGLVKLPVNTRLCPITFAQRLNGKEYRFRLSVAAGISMMEVESLSIDPTYFPDVSVLKPVGAVKLNNFRLRFPTPKVKTLKD